MRQSPRPVKNTPAIPYGRQSISSSDIKSVVSVLKSKWLTQGPAIPEFEATLASFCGAKFAVAVSSGTAALHLACRAAGLSRGDEAITTPLSFVATSNSVLFTGARPVFVDIDPNTLNIDAAEIERRITGKTKVILPVHFGGYSVNLKEISRIAKKRNLIVIEDGCHALGGRYKIDSKWYRVGSCSHSKACVFSFHPVKTMTTGEGGAITTNDESFYKMLVLLRTHGITKDPQKFQNPDMAFWYENHSKQVSPWYYEMQELGFNYRITDFQAALGLSQLHRVKSWIKRRTKIAAFYDRAFAKLPGIVLRKNFPDSKPAHHIYILQLTSQARLSRVKLFAELLRRGIIPQVHYIPIHRQPYYQKLGYRKGDFPEVEKYYDQALTLPLFPAMKDSEVRYVVQTVLALLGR